MNVPNDDRAPIVGVLPAGGWWASTRCDDEPGVLVARPVIGWLVYGDGTARPLRFVDNLAAAVEVGPDDDVVIAFPQEQRDRVEVSARDGYTCASCRCAFDGVSPEAEQRATDDQLCPDCAALEGGEGAPETEEEQAATWARIAARRVFQQVMGQ
jgi:hypothetical protein